MKLPRISRNLVVAQFLGFFFVVICTLTVFILFNLLVTYFKIELSNWFNYFVIIGMSAIISTIFASCMFNNVFKKPSTIYNTYHVNNDRRDIRNNFQSFSRNHLKSSGEKEMDTANNPAENEPGEDEDQLRVVINRTPISIVWLDKDAVIMDCNPAFQMMLGYNHEELVGKSFHQTIHPDDVSQSKKLFSDLVDGKIGVYKLEQHYIRKDLRHVLGALSASAIRDAEGKISYIVLMIEDITDRRKVESRIKSYQKKLRLLTSKLSLVEEHKRHLCATDLHDHIGQVLLGIRLKIGKLLQDHPEQEPNLAEVMDLIDQVIKCTRSLIYELSPPILYELGLEETIEWLSENLARQHGIKTKLNRDNQLKPLETEMRILLFQAVREVMDNIVKHAKATFTTTSIVRKDNDLIVVIEDNGVGFDPSIKDLQTSKDHELGLFGIGDRLEHVGGKLEIDSEPGKGTRVTISVPLVYNNKINWTELLKRKMPTVNG